MVIAGWQGGLLANHQFQVSILVRDGGIVRCEETTEDHRSLIHIRSFYMVGRQQHNGRIPRRAVHTHIHAPLLHLLHIDDIRRPQVAIDVVTIAISC